MGTKRWTVRCVDRRGDELTVRRFWTKWGADRAAARDRALAETYTPFGHGPLFDVDVRRSS